MFRRKDEAYDTQDLLHDVMGGIDDNDLPETSKHKLSPANLNIAALDANPSVTQSNNSQKGASTMETNDNNATNIESAATLAASNPSSPAALAAAAMTTQAKPAPAAAFRSQAMPSPVTAASALAARSSAVPATMSTTSVAAASSKRVLTVGQDINMNGAISTCDRLVIEGSVDASLSDVHTVEIAQTGSFKGTAEIQDAEISGSFEGDLIVNGRLTIYATGRVSGNVAYGEIEIERGGKLTGTIKTADEIKSSQSQAPRKAA